ncbi:MAG: response regulator transcription factor [Calditrichia bacterium]
MLPHTAKPIPVAIIEDNRYIRRGWEMTLKSNAAFMVTGVFSSCEEAFASGKTADAHMVLMDIHLPGMSGIDGMRYLKKHNPRQEIIVCTVHEDDEIIFDAICAGADGFMAKKTPPDEFIQILWKIRQGGSPITPYVARKIIAVIQKSSVNNDEWQILTQIARGDSYLKVAKEQGIEVSELSRRIRRIYRKVQAMLQNRSS